MLTGYLGSELSKMEKAEVKKKNKNLKHPFKWSGPRICVINSGAFVLAADSHPQIVARETGS